MKLSQYLEGKKFPKKVSGEIQKRWDQRIVAGGLLNQAPRQTVVMYLQNYGKGIGTDKVLALGHCAQANGAEAVAVEFFKHAAGMENVTIEAEEGEAQAVDAEPALPGPRIVAREFYPQFPEMFQPGRFDPMQPVDAHQPREFYLRSPLYWGQKKKDGIKLLTWATDAWRMYQARSMNLHAAPSVEIDQAMAQVAADIGNFIVEGELTYLDFQGGEHRSGAQAAEWNAKHGQPEAVVEQRYCIFACLFLDGMSFEMKRQQVDGADFVGGRLAAICDRIEVVVTAKDEGEKRALAARQEVEGREGEVWFEPGLYFYNGKKETSDAYVRTKYPTPFQAIVGRLKPSKNPVYEFGSFEMIGIGEREGELLGWCSGFSDADRTRLFERHQRGERILVNCESYGWTEKDKAWLPRFKGFAN